MWHRRPLDEAIDARCCPEIIEMLVGACPAAVSEDESGCTPLASAIQNGLCADIIRILVDANPSALKVADGSGLPLRKALEYQASPSVIDILACDAETVTAVDSMGRSSLHLALQWSAYNFSVVKILLEKAPHAATLPNSQNQTPLGVPAFLPKRSWRQRSQSGDFGQLPGSTMLANNTVALESCNQRGWR